MNREEIALDLATRIETNPLGWLPVVGDVINVTFTPEEARLLVLSLRALPAQGEPVAAAIEAGAQALADDVWHPPQKLENLSVHEANKFRRQARLVLAAALPPSPGPQARDLDRFTSIWEDPRVRVNVHKEWPDLAAALDRLALLKP